MIAVLALVSLPAWAQVSVSIGIAPPPLQVETQPVCPGDGYLWTPGYWAYGDGSYTWMPGEWVQPPQPEQLWTPPYWGWNGSAFAFNAGYWGPTVGYYGGINYGHGYGGNGYGGGRWQGGHFAYNTAVNNVNTTNIHNTYIDKTVINNHASRVSYNGGKDGVQGQPRADERKPSVDPLTSPASVRQPDANVQPRAQAEPKDETMKDPAQAPRTENEEKKPAPEDVHPQAKSAPKPEVHAPPQASASDHDKKGPDTNAK